jgi:hypothetical protein
MSKQLAQCDCCDYFTIPDRSDYEICPVCFWEQDDNRFDRPDEESGANQELTLRQGRRNFEVFQACSKPFVKNVVSASARQTFKRSVRQLNNSGAFTVDCIDVQEENDFWEKYLSVTQPQGVEFFGKNLDAFFDALNGGPGYPGNCVIYFINTTSIKDINSGHFYSALQEISQNSNSVTVHIE